MIALADSEIFARGSHIRGAINAAREAQQQWAACDIRRRARMIGDLRPRLAEGANDLAREAAAVHRRPLAEKLVSEVLPLIEACRFLEKNAASILRTKRFGRRGRPLWLSGSLFEIERKPHGIVLIVAPSNYPLFIPAVQTLHAIAAGNAVLLKPHEDAAEVAARFVELTHQFIPSDLIQLLPANVEAAHEAVSCGIDKVIFTGASQNGRAFLRLLAKTSTPSVMELSGADIVYVRRDADLERAAKAIAFGQHLNGGNTCIAPRSVIADRGIARHLAPLIDDVDVIAVDDDDEAAAIMNADEHGLGAAIFSRDETAARALATRISTGFVTINDLIVPTADPRFPFGGTRASGFGVTRGAEGLLEMTYPHVIALRRSNFLPHLREPHRTDAQLFAAFIALLHSRGWRARWRALVELTRAVRARRNS